MTEQAAQQVTGQATGKTNKNQTTGLKTLRRGLAIYRTGRSPFWHVRLYDSLTGKYVKRSTKETSRIEAIAAAYEFADSYRSKSDSEYAKKKNTSFEYYANRLIEIQANDKYPENDNWMLNRPDDGIISYFGKYDVSKINTGTVRDYLILLDKNREKKLAESTKTKHVIIIRKVLRIAVEEGVLNDIPVMPKVKIKDNPRSALTDKEYVKLLEVAQQAAKDRVKVRGVEITNEHFFMIGFVVNSFVRPIETELFGLRVKDVEVNGNHLILDIKGKTGTRRTVTMPDAFDIYERQIEEIKPKDFLFMDGYKNRETAVKTFRRIFHYLCEKAGIEGMTPYSLRHTSLQMRLRHSGGKINIYDLAKNAGTSVSQLERFYLKYMEMNQGQIETLHTTDPKHFKLQ